MMRQSKGRLPHPKIFLCISASAADPAAVNPNGIKTLLANGSIAFFINGILVLLVEQKVDREILLIVSSWITEFLIT